jgi:hypothetical protein
MSSSAGVPISGVQVLEVTMLEILFESLPGGGVELVARREDLSLVGAGMLRVIRWPVQIGNHSRTVKIVEGSGKTLLGSEFDEVLKQESRELFDDREYCEFGREEALGVSSCSTHSSDPGVSLRHASS